MSRRVPKKADWLSPVPLVASTDAWEYLLSMQL